jgi:hypothetical protein
MSLRALAGYDDAPSAPGASFSKRSDLMSLNTLDAGHVPKSAREFHRGYDPLSTADITGASPRQPFSYRDKDQVSLAFAS